MLCNYLNVSKCFSCRQILPNFLNSSFFVRWLFLRPRLYTKYVNDRELSILTGDKRSQGMMKTIDSSYIGLPAAAPAPLHSRVHCSLSRIFILSHYYCSVTVFMFHVTCGLNKLASPSYLILAQHFHNLHPGILHLCILIHLSS